MAAPSPSGSSRERRIRRLQKYVTNPPAKLLLGLGLLPYTALLETTGRRTGQPRRTPVGNGHDKATDTFWIVAEHGRGAAWVRNAEANPRVRVKIGRRWRTGTAVLLPDDDPLERQRALARLGRGKRVNAAAVRAMGTRLLRVRIDLDPPPRRRAAGARRTAEVNALQRAAESRLPAERRLLHDPYAHLFVTSPGYRALLALPPLSRAGLRWLDSRFPGLHVAIMLRARYVEAAIARGGFEQVVLLGAGYDSTALRHPGVTVFEVDAPSTQRAKRAVLAERGLASRAAFVPCDFERDSPAELLERAGHDGTRPTLSVWLGVSYYLTLDAFRSALAGVASWTAPGGTLVWDYMDPDVSDGTTTLPGARRAAEWVRARGEPYLLGFTPDAAREELGRVGFEPVADLRMTELADRFAPPGGVWCSTDDWMGVIEAERRAA